MSLTIHLMFGKFEGKFEGKQIKRKRRLRKRRNRFKFNKLFFLCLFKLISLNFFFWLIPENFEGKHRWKEKDKGKKKDSKLINYFYMML